MTKITTNKESKYDIVRRKVLETLIENKIPYELETTNEYREKTIIYIDTPILDYRGDMLYIVLCSPISKVYFRFEEWDEIVINGFRITDPFILKYYDFIEELKLLINKNFRVMYQDEVDLRFNDVSAIFFFDPKINTLEEALEKFKKLIGEKVRIIEITNYNKTIYAKYKKPKLNEKKNNRYKRYLENTEDGIPYNKYDTVNLN